MTFPLPKKSTIVRIKRAAVRCKKAVLRVLFTVAEPTLPGSAARLAERLWFRCPPTRVAAALPPVRTSQFGPRASWSAVGDGEPGPRST